MKSLRNYGSLVLAVCAVLVLVLWMGSGEVSTSQDEREDIWQDSESSPSRVQVETFSAEVFQPQVVLQGQVEPWQQLTLRARIDGDVESLPVSLGQTVKQGQTLLTLSDEARGAQLAQSRAELERAEADLRGAQALRGRDLGSEAELMRLKAEVARARTNNALASQAVADRTPKAPFAGVVDRRDVELGDYVRRGEQLLQLVDVSRLKVTARVPQQKVGRLETGQPVRVSLLTGETLQGELTFIASAADPQTRTFAIEASVKNPEQLRIAGGSATVRIAQETLLATRISPAYLSLADSGKLSVKYVDKDSEVQQTAIELLSADNNGAWVGGLPLETRIITQGAGFVRPGERVEAIHADGGD